VVNDGEDLTLDHVQITNSVASGGSNLGPYAASNENFLYDLADGVAAYGANLHIYDNAGPHYWQAPSRASTGPSPCGAWVCD
jgi:hypothetical protein